MVCIFDTLFVKVIDRTVQFEYLIIHEKHDVD